ncbi:hypothetical protein L2E82_01391 [Cichorium intybus]|uniref:Uncharacterized protein n=1 Tax=Cichorium intybus TaxID=13427 RepID=A0ACB9GYE8_CICIN|nr:hypothetical protein L2E82_01391 [Cichorium intybus]
MRKMVKSRKKEERVKTEGVMMMKMINIKGEEIETGMMTKMIGNEMVRDTETGNGDHKDRKISDDVLKGHKTSSFGQAE